MNRQSFSLGQIKGIPIRIDYSWFLIFALLSWTLATGYYPAEFKNWPAAWYWGVGVVTALLFFSSVLLHELGHSLVAARYQLPVRSITLYIFGGLSELSQEPATAVSNFWITITGPIVNLALAGLLALFATLASGFAPLLALFKYLAYINLLLGLFNLIPGFPLDGGSVLMSIIWWITRKKSLGILIAGGAGTVFAYVFISLGAVQILGGNWSSGLWTAFIGWFLLTASKSQVQKEKLKEVLAGHKVSEAMSRSYTIIYADTTLQDLVDEHILGGSRRSFVIKKDDEVVGFLTMHALQAIPKESWPTTTVNQVMIPITQFQSIPPNTEIWEVLEKMNRDGVNQLPVMAEGQVQGMFSREDLVSYLHRLQGTGAA